MTGLDPLNWLRLTLGFVAVVHALLSARVVIIRIVRRGTEAPHPERVPTAAMVAYGIATSHIAYVLLRRVAESEPIMRTSLIAYAATLLAGSIAFTQIVVLVRRSRRGARSPDQ